MRKFTLVGGLAAVLASMVLVLPPPAVSACGGGGGGGGSGEVYSDLFIALRDVNGVPILSPTFYESDSVQVTCIQPISYAVVDGATRVENPVDGRMVSLIPLVGMDSTALAPVAEADTACDPQPDYATYASEASSGG